MGGFSPMLLLPSFNIAAMVLRVGVSVAILHSSIKEITAA
jgi:hypothetical protein